MSSNAAGQLLGYSIQYPRALLSLLNLDRDNQAVAIEVYGDVATLDEVVPQRLEEVKSSIHSNPLTDASENLWKTFSNWLAALKNNNLDASKIKFILYANCLSSSDSLVCRFSKCSNANEADALIEEACQQTKTITSQTVRDYCKKVLHEERDVFSKIVLNFSFESTNGTNALYEEVRNKIRAMMIPDSQCDWLLERLSGWLQIYINKKIAASEPAIITFQEFRHAFLACFVQCRSKQLIDFASTQMPSKEKLREDVRSRPIYIQQLELIGLPYDEMIEAAADYFKAAETNRHDWIEKDYINEESMADFENRLISFHKTERKRISLTQSRETEDVQGALLLYECQRRSETIANMTPPDRTIQGTYHSLADEKTVGWHPCWEEHFSSREGEE